MKRGLNSKTTRNPPPKGPLLSRTIRLSPFSRYGVAIGVAAAAVAIRLALEPIWAFRLPYITLFPAIMVSAWLAGLWPGVVTTLLSALAAQYFWIEPIRSLAIPDTTEFIGLALFVAIGVFISILNEAWRRSIDAVGASEERLRVTLLSLGDAVIATDEQGRITQLNPIAERLTGWSQSDAVDRRLGDVLVIVNEETRRPAPNPVERVLREGMIAGLANHTLLISRDGREIPIDDSAAPVRTEDGRIVGAVMVFRDITQRRQIERERAEREGVSRQLASIVESSEDAILGTDLDGTITAWNRAAERMYGYSASEAIGKSIRLIVPDDHAAEEERVLARIRAGDRVEHFETVRRRRDGTQFPVSLALSPVRDANGTVIGASKIARDITLRKEMEERTARILSREQVARAEVERASRLKDEFLAVLSHELRTPLNAVLGYAHLLGSGTLPPERAAHAVEAIQRNAQAQARLVESLLDLSRLLAGKLELDLQRVNLSQLVGAAVDIIRPEVDAKGIAIDVSTSAGEIAVVGDPSRLQQVLWNLLANAAKFTSKGGRIEVRVAQDESQVRIQVRDTGQGINPQFLPHVFERFRQEHRHRSQAGLGLGLAVVREMVQAHGGTVVAESEGEGRGSLFTVTLPSDLSVPPRSQVVAGGDPIQEHASLAGLNILVIDDDEDGREVLALILESRGATVRAVSSASEALDAVQQRRPDVLVADLRMPGEDGFSLIRKLRAREHEQQVGRTPAVAVTAYASATDREKAIAAGYDWHVAKPIDPDTLARVVARLSRTGGSEWSHGQFSC